MVIYGAMATVIACLLCRLNNYFMKYLKLILVLGFILMLRQVSQCQDYIRYNYLGTAYQPLEGLLISKRKVKDTSLFLVRVIVSAEDYLRFQDTVLAYLPKNNQKWKNDFGCFVITLNSKGRTKNYFLSNPRISIQYFRNILSFARSTNWNEKLNIVLQSYLTRIQDH